MKEKTRTWFELAKNDLEFAASILQNKNRPYYAVHYCHQAIEKILKALVQETTGEDPKRTHSFKVLCMQAKATIPASVEQFLAELSPHYLASRYPEDMRRLYAQYSQHYVLDLLRRTEEVFLWFKERITSGK